MRNKVIYIITIFISQLIPALGQNIVKESIDSLKHEITNKKDSSVNLKEFVVSAKLPQVKTVGAITTVRIQGTQLSRLGNANKILANTPGLHLGGEGIEVNGMGKPIFVMKGREIDPDKVLSMLKGNKIKEIKINKSPDNEFSSTGQPTVEIILTQPLEDFLSLVVGYDPTFRRHFDNTGDLNIGFKKGIVASDLSLLGGNMIFENRESYFRNIYNDKYVANYTQQRTNLSKEPLISLRWASDLIFDKVNSLGFEYYFRHTSGQYNQKGRDMFDADNKYSESFINNIDDRIANLHNFSLIYNLKKKKWSMQFVQEFTLTNRKSFLKAQQAYIDKEETPFSIISTSANRNYWTSSSHLKFTYKLPWKLNLTAGAKYIYVSSNRETNSDNPYLYNGNYNLKSEVNEYTPEVYANFSRSFKPFRITAGIRYRFVKRNTSSLLTESSPNNISFNHSYFIPTLSVNYSKKGWSAFIRYNRSIRQPEFGLLNSGLTYKDSLTYSNGNPDLKVSTTDMLTGGVSWKSFTLTARWKYSANPITEIYEQMTPGSDIIVGKSINLSSSKKFSVSLAYSKTFSIFNLYAEGEINCPSDHYNFLGKDIKADRIYFTGNINASVDITDNFGAYTSFTYQGRNTTLITTQRSAYNWIIGLSGSFFKNRLTASIEYTDVFHKANYNNLINRYGNIETGTYGTNDLSGISISISYSIFNKKIKANTRRENDELIFRLN